MYFFVFYTKWCDENKDSEEFIEMPDNIKNAQIKFEQDWTRLNFKRLHWLVSNEIESWWD